MKRVVAVWLLAVCADAQVAVVGDTVHTMAGPPLRNGVVLIRDGRIERVGEASAVSIPSSYRVIKAAVVTPGLIDAHSTVGISGYLNQQHDQDQVERSAPSQADLRALDAFNGREKLVEYVRSFGITTVHSGHGPGALISGQTMLTKTSSKGTADATAIRPVAAVAVTLGDTARAETGKSPGTRSKMVAMLRSDLVKASEYARKQPETRDLRIEALVPVIRRELPLMITAQRAADILNAIRIGKEFNLRILLDGASDAHLVLNEIKASGYPVLLHPSMARAFGEMANLSLVTAAKLREHGIPFAFQSGFEGYVPKTRVVLFEAAMAAANGLSFDDTLRALTAGSAELLGISDRVGTLEPGKDADLALFDGDPFEYTTHCTGVLIDGVVHQGENWAVSD
jgi:imidazolonepropionase-like amidohydrolase